MFTKLMITYVDIHDCLRKHFAGAQQALNMICVGVVRELSVLQGRRQRGGQWCPAPHLKSVPPFHVWPPDCCIHPTPHLKNLAPPFWFLAPPAAKSWRRACCAYADCVCKAARARAKKVHPLHVCIQPLVFAVRGHFFTFNISVIFVTPNWHTNN